MKLANTLIVLMLLTLANGIIYAQSPNNPELETIIQEANSYYRQAMETAPQDAWKAKKLYEKAAIYYEKLTTDNGIKNGKLYYNLGNAYFRMGDIGRAILNYLKAQQYIPNDKNLLQNLDYARAKRIDKVTEKEQQMGLKIIFFFHYYIPVLLRLAIFIICFVLIWIFAILKLFFKQGLLNFFLIISIIVVILFAGSLFFEITKTSSEHPGVVLATELIARKGDSDTYEKSFQEPLHAGTEFILIEERRNWYEVELKDGRTCWIQTKDVGLVK